MGSNEYILDLETEIAIWQSSRASDDSIKFDVGCHGRIEIIQMKGLAWSVEARRMPNCKDYIFNIIDVNPPESLLHLQAKLDLLLVALQRYVRSMLRVEELLDKLYACSCFLSRAENEKRWWTLVDAEIMGVACETAREATQEAAKAAAAILVELMQPLPFSPRAQDIIREEVCWATSFSGTEETWNIGVAQAAINGGNVLQWCKVRVLETESTFPSFELEVAVEDLLQGNDVVCKIGLVNSSALKVNVRLGEKISVVCSQEGVEPETSVGLRSLLPHMIRNYIETVPEGEDGAENVVERVLERVVGYLAFVPRVCEVCESHRIYEEDSWSSMRICSNICKARKYVCGASLPKLTWPTDHSHGLGRGEGNVRINPLSNTEAAREGLSTLILRD